MAMETLVVGKCGNASTPVELIKGDNYTQKIMMRVPRYFGGVDLAPLAWSVTAENAAGATDQYALSAIRGEDAIEMGWIPGGTATAVPGIVKFKLSGYAQDGSNVLIWQSGTYHIRVKDTFSHTPGSEVAAELTGVQKLIIYVDGELNKVIKAGTDAAEAAKAANAAADRANSVADGKNEGRITALEQFTTKPVEPYAVEGKLVQLDNFEGMPMNAVTRIEPAQAGSGDPYPAGGGKNLVSESSATGALSAYTKVLHIKSELMPNTTYTLSFVASQAGNNLYLNEYISARQYLTTTGKRQSITFTTAEEVAKNNAVQYDTELGWIVFKNGITNVEPVTFSDVQLELGSTATAYVPYANIRPISGHTGAKLTKCGKNLISRPYIDVQKTENGITISVNDDGSISANGTPNAQTRLTLVDKFTLLPGTYTLSGTDKASTGHVDIQVLDPSYNLLANVNNYGKTANTFTITEATTVKINIYFGAGNTAEWTWIRPQLELGTAATAYEPYHGETFSASFGQTVYGGTLDWGTGVLTVDRAILRLTGTENVQFSSGGAGRFVYYDLQNVIKPFSNSAIVAPIVCSHYKPSTAEYLYNTPDAYAIAQNNGTEIWFSDTGFDSPSAFKAYLSAQNAAGTPVQVCYKLANPTTIQLTPAQLTALQGMNNIFCDAGETTVSGRKDILWLTSGLIEQIDTLKKAIISLGGNV